MSLWIKICGNTSLADALLAANAGADAVGFVFAPSPRRVTVEQVAAITPHLPATIEKIGVFVDASLDEIAATVKSCALTGVQLHFDAPPELPTQLRTRLGPELRIFRVLHFDARQAVDRTGFVTGHDFSRVSMGLRHTQVDENVSECPLKPNDLASVFDRAEDAKGLTEALQARERPCFVTGHDFSRADNANELTRALAPDGWLCDPEVDAILVDSRTTTTVGGTGVPFDWETASATLFQSAKARKRLIAAGGLNPENVAEAIRTLRPWGIDAVSGVESAPGRKDPFKVRVFVAQSRTAGR